MKKTVFVKLLFAALAIGTLIGFTSCKKKPACEKENFGTVVIINHTVQDIWVDCTPEGENNSDERFLSVGDSTEYHMTPGQVTEWAIEDQAYPGGAWHTDSYYVGQCEVHRDPWTSGKSAKVDTGKN